MLPSRALTPEFTREGARLPSRSTSYRCFRGARPQCWVTQGVTRGLGAQWRKQEGQGQAGTVFSPETLLLLLVARSPSVRVSQSRHLATAHPALTPAAVRKLSPTGRPVRAFSAEVRWAVLYTPPFLQPIPRTGVFKVESQKEPKHTSSLMVPQPIAHARLLRQEDK